MFYAGTNFIDKTEDVIQCPIALKDTILHDFWHYSHFGVYRVLINEPHILV
jgi:hypothetical protein